MAAQEIGSLFINLAMNTASVEAQLKSISAEFKGFGSNITNSLSSAVGGMKAIAASMAALGLTEAIKAVAEWADAMASAGEKAVLLGQSLGIPLQQITDLEGVFQLTAGSIEGASTTILKLNKNVADAMVNADDMRQNFAAIGITLQDLTTKGRDPVEMLKLLADRFMKYEDDAVKSAVFTKLLGKSWQEVVGILGQGADGIQKLTEQARALDPAAVSAKEAGSQLDDQLDILRKTVVGLSNEAFVALAPELISAAQNMAQFASDTRTAIAALNDATSSVGGLVGILKILGQNIPFLGAIGSAGALTRSVLGVPDIVLPQLDVGGSMSVKTGGKVQPPPKGGGGKGGGGDSRVSQWRDELDTMLIAERKFFKDNKKDELAFWQEKLKLTAEGSKEWLTVRKTIFELEKQLAIKRRDDLIADAEHDSQINDELFSRKKQRIQSLLTTEQLSAQEALDQERSLTEQKWVADQEYYARKKAAAEGDTETLDKLNKQQALDHEKHLTTLEGLQNKKVETMFGKLKQLSDDLAGVLGNAFSSAFDKISEGTFKLRDALGALLKDLGRTLANRAFKALLGGDSGDGGGILGGLLGKLATRLVGGVVGGAVGGGTGPFGDNWSAKDLGMASGGSFRVGGAGAIDSKLIGFRATPGELIDVTPASQRGGPGGGEVIRIDLNPSEGWVSGIADQQIVTRSGTIVNLAVRQSQKTTQRNFAGMSAEAQARQM